MNLMEDVYVYVNKKDYKSCIALFQKYNVCCKGSVNQLVGKYTFTKSYFNAYKGDTILHIKMDRDLYRSNSYSFGEKLFEFSEKENKVAMQLFTSGDSKALETIGAGEGKYKAFAYVKYQMIEALPFTDKEYENICGIEEFDFDEFKDSLDEEGITTIEDLVEYEEFSLEPSAPEKEYMDKISNIFDIIDNEIEETVRFPEDETKALINIDFTPVKKELKDLASDYGIKIKIGATCLEIEIIEQHKVITPVKEKELKDLYKFVYEDSNSYRVLLARELRQKETGFLY